MKSPHVRELTDDNFDAEVLRSDRPALVDFTAGWCAPCRAIAPLVESLAEKYRGAVTVGMIDADENQAVPARYGVRSLPTLLLFQNGKVVAQFVGAGPKLRGNLEEAFAKVTERSGYSPMRPNQ
jgi:thioredoxin 1